MIFIFIAFFSGVVIAGNLAQEDDFEQGRLNGCINGVLSRVNIFVDDDLTEEQKNSDVVRRLPNYCYILLDQKFPEALTFFYDAGGEPQHVTGGD